jgi:ubiquinone/menaquinone biosynthesis C-methylase UbiE
MSTQYNAIGTGYNDMKSLPAARLERANVHRAVAPHVSGAKVLDLACGTGYYSLALLEWGATSVVGVDISQAMVEGARKAAKAANVEGKAKFLVGDCSKPVAFEGGPFDLVVAAWLLNYAPNRKEMTDMFECIRMNLKEGAVFVGITQPPAEDLKREAELSRADPWRKYGVSLLYKKEIEDGYKTRVVGHVAPETVEFDNYYLRKSVYEESARAGGMQGRIVWNEITLPQHHRDVLGKFEDGFWDDDLNSPHFGVMTVGR